MPSKYQQKNSFDNPQKKDVKAGPASSNWPELEQIPITSKGEINIDNCKVQLTNVNLKLFSCTPLEILPEK
jgi:hypothetical protein